MSPSGRPAGKPPPQPAGTAAGGQGQATDSPSGFTG